MAVTARTIGISGGSDSGSGRVDGATVSSGITITSAPTAVTVAAAVAVLVADAATPTQAHVTTLAAAWAALLADLGAALGGKDFLVAYDTTAIGTHSKFRALLRAAEHAAARGGLT